MVIKEVKMAVAVTQNSLIAFPMRNLLQHLVPWKTSMNASLGFGHLIISANRQKKKNEFN